ncbi:phosphonate ABC transporter substrate-binding protein [Halomonas salipaludis]|uniref:Phosphonate ABC transporter substrate-binding protein n=1 Tax=Halomonas salipaludis TaxID=2032625 RepID=A0A2A2EV55_9GAMM|nr:phosphonate ABC transporter substrate-binding protein [Halomonas salipaludis]PAU77301.1 phosphonate ABC transporter substrate-binding protein [Halomonas salipaludis]
MLCRALRHITLPVIASLGLLGSQYAAAEELDTLRFGIISTESSQNQEPQWRPFLEDMSASLGIEVEPFFANDYAAVIQAMRFDKIDLAWYGNKSAMEAVDRAGGEIFAQVVHENGQPGYRSLLIVHRESPFETVEDILANASELTFGNGDPNSTSGYLVPGYYVFAQNDVDPRQAFKRSLNSNHETNALSVANQQIDVATFNSGALERLELNAADKAEQLKVIWESPLIPSNPLVWREALPAEMKAKLRDFFEHYGETAEQHDIIAPLQWAGFKASDNDQLLPIRQLELFKQRLEIENDDGIADDDKARRLAELDAQLAELDERLEAREAAQSEREAPDVAAVNQ